METEYVTNRWLRRVDMTGMVLAPISLSLPFFLMTALAFLAGKANNNDYIAGVLTIFAGLMMLILFGHYFWRSLKSYVHHQLTREDVVVIRVVYTGFIIGGILVFFLVASFKF